MIDETPSPQTGAGSGAGGGAFVRFRDTRSAALHAGQHARRIGFLRWALPVFVLVVLGVLIAWPLIRSPRLQQAVIAEVVPNLMIENLHFTGLDDTGRPYSITADRALQVADVKGAIDLEKPSMETTLEAGAWVHGQAQLGRYDENKKRLWLKGAVQIFHDAGYQFLSDEAEMDLTKRTAWGSQPVQIQGPFGEIRGQGFRMAQGGRVLAVTGPARALLVMNAGGGAKGQQLQAPRPSDTKNKPK